MAREADLRLLHRPAIGPGLGGERGESLPPPSVRAGVDSTSARSASFEAYTAFDPREALSERIFPTSSFHPYAVSILTKFAYGRTTSRDY